MSNDSRPLPHSPYYPQRLSTGTHDGSKGMPGSPVLDRMPWSSEGRPRSAAGIFRTPGRGETRPGSVPLSRTRLQSLADGPPGPLGTGGHSSVTDGPPGPIGSGGHLSGGYPSGGHHSGEHHPTVTAAEARPGPGSAEIRHRTGSSTLSAQQAALSAKPRSKPATAPSALPSAPPAALQGRAMSGTTGACDLTAAVLDAHTSVSTDAHTSVSTPGLSLCPGVAEGRPPEPNPERICDNEGVTSPSPGPDYEDDVGRASPSGSEVPAAGQMTELPVAPSSMAGDGPDRPHSPSSSFPAASNQPDESRDVPPTGLLLRPEAMTAAGQEASTDQQEASTTSTLPASAMPSTAANGLDEGARPTEAEEMPREGSDKCSPRGSEEETAASRDASCGSSSSIRSGSAGGSAAAVTSGRTSDSRDRERAEGLAAPGAATASTSIPSSARGSSGSVDGAAQRIVAGEGEGDSSARGSSGSVDGAAQRIVAGEGESGSSARGSCGSVDGAAEPIIAGGGSGSSARGSGGSVDGASEPIIAGGGSGSSDKGDPESKGGRGRDGVSSEAHDGGGGDSSRGSEGGGERDDDRRGDDCGGRPDSARPTRLREEELPASSFSCDVPFASTSTSECEVWLSLAAWVWPGDVGVGGMQ